MTGNVKGHPIFLQHLLYFSIFCRRRIAHFFFQHLVQKEMFVSYYIRLNYCMYIKYIHICILFLYLYRKKINSNLVDGLFCECCLKINIFSYTGCFIIFQLFFFYYFVKLYIYKKANSLKNSQSILFCRFLNFEYYLP